MTRHLILFFLLGLDPFQSPAQTYSEVIAFRTERGDTTHFHISKKSVFNTRGSLIQEIDYESNTSRELSYDDTLVTTIETHVRGELVSVEHRSYNALRLLSLAVIMEKEVVVSIDTYNYDHRGYMTVQEDMTASGGERTIYAPDATGHDTLEITYALDENGQWLETCRSTSKWNSNGKLVEWNNMDCHQARNPLETWNYDDQGRLNRHRTFTESGDLYRDEVYFYSEGGYCTISTGFDPDGSEKQLNTNSWEYQPQYFTYSRTDGNGRLTEERTLNEKGELFSLQLFKYDARGNLTQKTYCNGAGTLNSASRYEYKL